MCENCHKNYVKLSSVFKNFDYHWLIGMLDKISCCFEDIMMTKVIICFKRSDMSIIKVLDLPSC